MSDKIYLHFLILCCFLCQGITATSDEDNNEQSNILVRKRRVISHLPGASAAVRMEDANYVVSVQKNYRAHCVGAILSHYTVITAAVCVSMVTSYYRILSSARYESRGSFHNVTSKDVYFGHPPFRNLDGIALVTVDPPFVYSTRTGHIDFPAVPLAIGSLVTVSGWGCSYPPQPGPTTRRALRSITVPILNHTECQNAYRGQFAITEKHICTYDEQQYCARTDAGAPLVFNNRLAGIYVWKGERRTQRNPDVYINLELAEYTAWIKDKALLM